jgi:hypothetical protein
MRKLTTRRTRRPVPEAPWAASAPSPFDLDRIRELETENALLRARVADLRRRVDAETVDRAGATATLTLVDDRDVELDDLDHETHVDLGTDLDTDLDLDADDGTNEAFEAFLATPDPHLDRVRRFLLG